jgi:hypothetical protein
MKEGHIYIIQEREFLRSFENVYKIGRSINVVNRCFSYPKNSKVWCTLAFDDIYVAEKQLKKNCDKTFIKRKDIGDEYYECDVRDLIFELFNLCIAKTNTITIKDVKKKRQDIPWTCPSCGYETKRRGNMQLHFYNLKKQCPRISNDITLTEEIKQYVLINRVYHVPCVPTESQSEVNAVKE